MNIDWNSSLLWIFVLACLLPLIIAVLLGFFLLRFGRKRFEQFLNTDLTQMQASFNALQAANPNATTEQLISKITHQQALRCGIVGALTGLGGVFTLPIALPLDIYVSLRIQAALVDFIAHTYGHDRVSDIEARVRTHLIMSGSGQVTEATSRVVMRFVLRILGKSLSKIVPFIGALVAFAVNYAIVQAIGRITLRWYSQR